MQLISDVIKGAIKLNQLPDRLKYSSWIEFIKDLPNLLSVEVPTSVSGVIVGSSYPTETDRDKVWYRRDSAGNLIGTYAFQAGSWRPLYQLAPGQILWLYGDSSDIPEGFIMIDVGDPRIPALVVNTLMPQYIPNGSGGYEYFAVRWAGY